MATAEERQAALHDRDDRIASYIRKGWSVEAIADREGVEPEYAKDLRKRVAADRGLPTPKRGTSPQLPYGMSRGDGGSKFRMRLGTELAKLLREYHQLQISEMVGLPQRAQKAALDNPSTHNWTLGQIERLARACGKDFLTFIQEMSRP